VRENTAITLEPEKKKAKEVSRDIHYGFALSADKLFHLKRLDSTH